MESAVQEAFLILIAPPQIHLHLFLLSSCMASGSGEPVWPSGKALGW